MPKHIKSTAEFDAVLKSAGSRPVLVDFYATWCGPCQDIAPKLAALAKKYPAVTVLKVDVDKCDELASRYSVRSMPTFKVLKNGTVVSSFTGADVTKLSDTMKKYSK